MKIPELRLNRLSERERGIILAALSQGSVLEPEELPERTMYRRLLNSPGLFIAEIEEHDLDEDAEDEISDEKIISLNHRPDTTTNS